MNKNKTGVWGEIYSARYLRDNGFDIVLSNYYSYFGEIDLAAFKNDILHIIEVKTRGEDPLYAPALAVDIHKQKKIVKTTKVLLSALKLTTAASFDVVEVTVDKFNRLVNINYIEGAFEGGSD